MKDEGRHNAGYVLANFIFTKTTDINRARVLFYVIGSEGSPIPF